MRGPSPSPAKPRFGPSPIEVRRQFTEWAHTYDQDAIQYSWMAPKHLLDALARHHRPAPDQNVLDVGVGTGLGSAPYVEAGANVTGLDIAPEMFAEIRKKGLRFGQLKLHDFNGPLSHVDIEPSTYDLILSSGALHFANDLGKTVRELTKALKDEGLIALTFIPPQPREFGQHTHIHDPRSVRRMLRALRLEILEDRPCVAYHDRGRVDEPVIYHVVVARKQPLETRPATEVDTFTRVPEPPRARKKRTKGSGEIQDAPDPEKLTVVQFLIPLVDRDGTPYPDEIHRQIQSDLIDRFGGWSLVGDRPSSGGWRSPTGEVEYDDTWRYELGLPLDRVSGLEKFLGELSAGLEQTAIWRIHYVAGEGKAVFACTDPTPTSDEYRRIRGLLLPI